MYLKNRPPTDTNINTNLSLWLDTLVQNPKFWLYTGIGAAVVLVIVLLIVLVLRKRIVIAIALVKEGSKYVYNSCLFEIHHIPSILFQHFFFQSCQFNLFNGVLPNISMDFANCGDTICNCCRFIFGIDWSASQSSASIE